MFEDPNTEALLLVDATNAFNTLNREVALRNILHLCPSLGRVLINTYRDGAQLYIDGESIASAEGTTQGDPLAMAMYALGVKPLIETMSTVNEARQVWFADDCTTSGSVLQMSHWWEALLTYGPQYGYHPNATKTTLLVKPDYLEEASHLFKDTTSTLSPMEHVFWAPQLVPPHLSTPGSRTKSSRGLMS